MTTKLIVKFNNNPLIDYRCVVCGEKCTGADCQECLSNDWPPVCYECVHGAAWSDSEQLPWWPTDWWGHAFYELSSWWVYLE